jgi:hypothetical protein
VMTLLKRKALFQGRPLAMRRSGANVSSGISLTWRPHL